MNASSVFSQTKGKVNLTTKDYLRWVGLTYSLLPWWKCKFREARKLCIQVQQPPGITMAPRIIPQQSQLISARSTKVLLDVWRPFWLLKKAGKRLYSRKMMAFIKHPGRSLSTKRNVLISINWRKAGRSPKESLFVLHYRPTPKEP